VKDLILHMLEPDPDVRYGIKQIKQHKWFSTYTPPIEISKGICIGVDEQVLHPTLLAEMKEKNDIN
jgi:serine/threonine protein kinase